MEPFEVVLTSSAEKDLRRLDRQVLQRVIDTVGALVHDPFPVGCVKLTGADRLYRVRVGHYRVIYEVETEAMLVVVHYIRHRRDAYRQLP